MFAVTLIGDTITFPVAKITYVVALLIAIDPFAREFFYANYKGPVPAFVQFLLNNFRTGVLADNNHLLKYQRTKECYYNITTSIFDHTFLNLTSDFYVLKNFSYVIAWFVELNRLDNQLEKGKRYFEHYVQLDPVPMASNQPLILPGIFLRGNKAFWYKSCSSQDESYKRICQIIAHSIKSKLYKEEVEEIEEEEEEVLDESGFLDYMYFKTYNVEEVSLESLKRDLLGFILSYTPKV